VLHVMAAASFLVFFQAYLVAPLIPSLSVEFHASTDLLGMLVPAYMLPYGISTLFYGPISDRFGRKAVILTLLGLMVVTMAGVATANTAVQMIEWRLLGGAITGGTVPIALALLGDIFPYEERAGQAVTANRQPVGVERAIGALLRHAGNKVAAFLVPEMKCNSFQYGEKSFSQDLRGGDYDREAFPVDEVNRLLTPMRRRAEGPRS
jgi:sugar phosphate permease